MKENEGKGWGEVRREYQLERLDESGLPDDPLELLAAWIDRAGSSGLSDHTAMSLSTVDPEGQPSSRMVLLKEIRGGKLFFYTNYRSRKSRHLETNPRVAAHFFWSPLERQVKIEGVAEPVDASDSDRYFASRPFESNIAAWASPQSEVVPGRSFLEEGFDRYLKEFSHAGKVPRPVFWGGFAITPQRIEFWQGGAHRLHDRIEYGRSEGGWSRVRLAP